MIPQNLHKLKVEKSSHHLTSFAGLPLLSELAHQAGIVKQLDAISGLWQRRKDYSTSDYILGLAMTLIAGGEGLEDTRLLRSDAGLRQLVFGKLPAANSLGAFLRRFTNRSLQQLGEVATSMALRLVDPRKILTIDIDSTLIEAEKKSAKKSYKGFAGYNPVLAWLAEPNVFLGGVFREGNASPQTHIVSLLRYCKKHLPKAVRLRLRSDSAGYRLDLMEYCQSKGIEFAIAAPLNSAVRESIEGIEQKQWQLLVRGEETFLLGETIHVPGSSASGTNVPALRLIVVRRTSRQLALFKDALEYHTIVTSLPETISTEEVLDFYNQRGAAEKVIGELKTGYGLGKLPCGQLFANAAFFQICLLAYNLVQVFKHCALPERWKKFCVKNLRFRLLGQAAIIVRHARCLVVKLSRDYPFYALFEQARWAILSPPTPRAPI